ncbi:MAG: hypothetical protein PF481_10505 [Bacteroidales bacterium]|jgi:hypothetical protein|nr:hypothetical protein [Bacteroidales bacterium]
MHRIIIFIITLFVCFHSSLYAGTGQPKTEKDSLQNDFVERKPLKRFYINGNYRGMLYYRNLSELFDGSYAEEKMLLSTNDGGRNPQLQLDISGRPTARTYFHTDIFLYSPMQGLGYNTNESGLSLGVNIDGNINTNHGNISFRLGGIQYTKLSRLSLWSSENNGESLFEKNPWDYFQTTAQNYESYYGQGTMLRSFRWGNQFVQGLTVTMNDIPGNFEAKALIAKTPNNGGQASYLNTIPDISYGGSVIRHFGQHYVGINTYQSISKSDSINGKFVGYRVYSTDFSVNLWDNDLTFSGEIAHGQNVQSSDMKMRTGNGIDAKILSRRNLLTFPITLHGYYIEPEFINLNGGFKTFLEDATGFNGEGGSSNPTGAYMSDVDYINGNRKGIDLRTEFNIAGLKINVASGVSQELEQRASTISYVHRINGLVFSRIFQYQSNIGPDSTFYTYFRGYYEERSIDTTHADFAGTPIHFAVSECNLKYKFFLFDKPVYVFYLASITTTQNDFSAIPVGKEKAFVHAHYHELEAYFTITEKLVLTSYLGYENINGNEVLQAPTLNSSRKFNQTGKSLGLGLDLVVGHLINLNLRTRWFTFNDTYSSDSHYNGFESSLEMKIFF